MSPSNWSLIRVTGNSEHLVAQDTYRHILSIRKQTKNAVILCKGWLLKVIRKFFYTLSLKWLRNERGRVWLPQYGKDTVHEWGFPKWLSRRPPGSVASQRQFCRFNKWGAQTKQCSSHLILEYQGKIVFFLVSGPILIGFSRRFTKLKMNETA